MNVIAHKVLLEFAADYPEALSPLSEWYKHVRKADYGSFADVRADYGGADWVGGYIVFNIGGNKYRLIVMANFQYRTFWIKHVFTHKAYDAWEPE